FGVFARRMLKSGVRIVGGCCGTTPEHIRSMLGAVRMTASTESRPARAIELVTHAPPPPAKVPLEKRSRLGARIARGEFAVSVELNAPSGTDLSAIGKQVEAL